MGELKGRYVYSCDVPLRTYVVHLTSCQVGSGDKAVSEQLLAMGVTDRSILVFLAQIEEQIEHIVQVKMFLKYIYMCMCALKEGSLVMIFEYLYSLGRLHRRGTSLFSSVALLKHTILEIIDIFRSQTEPSK